MKNKSIFFWGAFSLVLGIAFGASLLGCFGGGGPATPGSQIAGLLIEAPVCVTQGGGETNVCNESSQTDQCAADQVRKQEAKCNCSRLDMLISLKTAPLWSPLPGPHTLDFNQPLNETGCIVETIGNTAKVICGFFSLNTNTKIINYNFEGRKVALSASDSDKILKGPEFKIETTFVCSSNPVPIPTPTPTPTPTITSSPSPSPIPSGTPQLKCFRFVDDRTGRRGVSCTTGGTSTTALEPLRSDFPEGSEFDAAFQEALRQFNEIFNQAINI